MAKQILVVDKNLAVQKLMEFALTREGFEVYPFIDGLSALDCAFKTPPALFVVDCRMEGINLTHFLEKVRQRETLKQVPVVLLINAGDTYDESKLGAMGVVDTIKKPLDPIELMEKIKTHAGKDEMDQMAAASEPSAPPRNEENIEPEDEMFKIEELLGWSTPPAKSPFSEIQQDKNQEGIGLGTELQIKTPEVAKAPNPPEEDHEEIILLEEAEFQAPATDQKQAQLTEASLKALSSVGMSAEAFSPVEEVIKPPPSSSEPNLEVQTPSVPESEQAKPSPIGQAAEEMTRQMVEEVVKKIAQEVAEKVAWEVIPPLAEITIKKEIERLMRDD
ncbi:MAG: response regulator [Nitrospiria bacterium]